MRPLINEVEQKESIRLTTKDTQEKERPSIPGHEPDILNVEPDEDDAEGLEHCTNTKAWLKKTPRCTMD